MDSATGRERLLKTFFPISTEIFKLSSFETGNGIKVEEVGTVKQGTPSVQGRSAAGADEDDGNNTVVVLQGSFSYTGPDGQLYSVK